MSASMQAADTRSFSLRVGHPTFSGKVDEKLESLYPDKKDEVLKETVKRYCPSLFPSELRLPEGAALLNKRMTVEKKFLAERSLNDSLEDLGAILNGYYAKKSEVKEAISFTANTHFKDDSSKKTVADLRKLETQVDQLFALREVYRQDLGSKDSQAEAFIQSFVEKLEGNASKETLDRLKFHFFLPEHFGYSRINSFKKEKAVMPVTSELKVKELVPAFVRYAYALIHQQRAVVVEKDYKKMTDEELETAVKSLDHSSVLSQEQQKELKGLWEAITKKIVGAALIEKNVHQVKKLDEENHRLEERARLMNNFLQKLESVHTSEANSLFPEMTVNVGRLHISRVKDEAGRAKTDLLNFQTEKLKPVINLIESTLEKLYSGAIADGEELAIDEGTLEDVKLLNNNFTPFLSAIEDYVMKTSALAKHEYKNSSWFGWV